MRTSIVNRYLTALLVWSVFVAFAVTAQGESKELLLSPVPANPYQNPYEARSYPDRLEIFRDGKQICTVRSEKPNIERWGFIDSGNHIVVISQDNTGPVIIELFDTVTCTRVDKWVMSSDQKLSPAWAADFLK